MGPESPAAGVIATRPATAPDAMPSSDGLPLEKASAVIQARPAAAGATMVLRSASAAPPVASRFDPALKPNQPTQSRHGADECQRQRMGREEIAAVTHALSDQQRTDEAGDARVDVHHRAAGEIECAELEQIAFGEPHHVGDRQVHEGQPQAREQHDGRELHPLGERADDERRSDRRESELKRQEGHFGNRHPLGEGVGGGLVGDAGEERL